MHAKLSFRSSQNCECLIIVKFWNIKILLVQFSVSFYCQVYYSILKQKLLHLIKTINLLQKIIALRYKIPIIHYFTLSERNQISKTCIKIFVLLNT